MKRRRFRDTERRLPSKELAEAMVATRTHLGMTREELAIHIHKNWITVRRWEKTEIKPRRDVLIWYLMRAPQRLRAVFEEHLGKTYDQILKERYLGFIREGEPQWKSDPSAHVNEIYDEVEGRQAWIWGRARNRDARAIAELVELHKSTVLATDRIMRRQHS